ncbi:hypothetical protein N7G274_010345 [Stereocaulon virgatum]|uniref:Uncharacterized protein n=1 Tax=Stereocaulon virgatum TaxID=373712 RepID=A0ABR3ZTR6_9LECA
MAAVATIWSSGIPWAQEPEYIAACRYHLQPGDPSSYNPPRNVGPTPTDVTGFQVGSASWDIDNLPDIFYVLWPCTEWRDFASSAPPAQKVDAHGNLMFEQSPWPGTQPRPLLDFPVFKDINTISTEVEWFLIEWWMRIDPRISWDDIEMRMEHVGKRAAYDNNIDLTDPDWPAQVEKAKSNFHNLLNMRTQRQGRIPFNMLSWRNKKAMHEKKNGPRDKVLGRLTPQQIAANTTRGATPGLIDVNAPDTAANRVALPGRRRQQRVLPQVAPANARHAQNNAPQTTLSRTHRQINGVAQPQVSQPSVPQLQTTVSQQSNVQHQFQMPDIVSPKTVQPNDTYNGSAAQQVPHIRNQHQTLSMAPSQPNQTKQNAQQAPYITPRQAQPPPPRPRPRSISQGQPQGLGGVPTIQPRQIWQSSSQYVDPNFFPIQAAATPTSNFRSHHQAPDVSDFVPPHQNQQFSRPSPSPPRAFNRYFRATATQRPSSQYPTPVLTAANAPRLTTKRTAASAFPTGGYKNGEVIDLDEEDYDDFEPYRPQKRVKKDSRGFKPVVKEEVTDHLDKNDGEREYQGLQNFSNASYSDLETRRPPVGRVPAASAGGSLRIKDGKRKSEPDDMILSYDGGQSQQDQNHFPQPPPHKRQQIRSLFPRTNPVLPDNLEPGNVAKHLAGIGQPRTAGPPKGRSTLQSSRAAPPSSAPSSLSQALSRAQKSREPNLGNQPTDTGPSFLPAPNVRLSQYQSYGDGYVDPMSPASGNSRPSFQQRHPSDVARVNRGHEQPNVLGPQTQHQRGMKNTSQRQSPGRRPNNQHRSENYLKSLFTSATNEHLQITQTGGYEARTGGQGVIGPDPEVKNRRSYMNQGPVPWSNPHSSSRSATRADHQAPPACLDPSTIYPSSSSQHTPQHKSNAVQGPYPTPATGDRNATRPDPQLRGAHHGQARGSSLTSSPLRGQSRPGLSDDGNAKSIFTDEDAARLFKGKDDAGQRIGQGSVEPNTNNTENKYDSATAEAFEAIDDEFFEALLRDEDQYQLSTAAIEIPEIYYIEAGFSTAEVDKWNAEAQATIDRSTRSSNDAVDGDNTGPSTRAAVSENRNSAKRSSEEVSTEELPADELPTELLDADSGIARSSASSENEDDQLGARLAGLENGRVLDLPFDVSGFSAEDEKWLLQQDSSDLF